MPKHRLSRKGRYIALATTAVAVVAGAGVAAQTSMAATAWPAQKTYTGRTFDACTAPSLTSMKAWKKDGYYGGVAVYVGGKNRGCAQPNLTSSWVKSVDTPGWRVIPLYVGAQPPCQKSGNKERFTAATAASVGASNAADAVARAPALGMKPGSPIHLNMEPYDTADKACNDATLTYVRSLHQDPAAKTYRGGLYGFSSSSAKAVATTKDRTDHPGNLWFCGRLPRVAAWRMTLPGRGVLDR
ncbi:glycoside hydrolase domain-containing protein [Streptomyces sp. NPDC002394]